MLQVDEIGKLRNKGPEEDKKEVEKIQSVLKLLAEIQERAQESEGGDDILRIDDLLRYMGNVKVEVLKDELCNILQDYDRKISQLKHELSDQSKNAEYLRDKNRRSKNKFITVNPFQTCEICYQELLSKAFYVFHCGHGYHRDCLLDSIENYETKNYRLSSMIELIRGFHSEIKNI